MLRPEELTPQRWRDLLDELDRRIADAIDEYVRSRFYGASDIASGFSELAKLRIGQEPNYNLPGVAVAYAFKYLPQRVTCLMGALVLAGWPSHPTSMLDIGSGSDAGSIALELLMPGEPMQIHTVEASSEMRGLAETIAEDVRKARVRTTADYRDLVGGRLRLEASSFDLVTLSAAVPYGPGESRGLAEQISQLTNPPALIVAIEPEVKKQKLLDLRAGFDSTGFYRIEDHCCHDLPDRVRVPMMMPRLTSLLQLYSGYLYESPQLNPLGRQMIGQPPFPVYSWNTSGSYRESLILCFE